MTNELQELIFIIPDVNVGVDETVREKEEAGWQQI